MHAGAGTDGLRAAGGDARLEPAFEAVSSDTCSVLSLDLFDTLLWRKVPEPVSAFIMLGGRLRAEGQLAPDIDASAFAVLRERAELRARRDREASGRGVEVTLRDICARIPPRTLRGIGLDELIEREVELERSLLVPDLDVLELARLAVERGKRVVCVSDTYFSVADLRSFLSIGAAGALDVERVFASSAHGVGKGGGLWRIVLDALGAGAAEVVHVGDNHAVDVVAAGRVGIRTVYFERRPAELARVLEREDQHATASLSPYHGDYGLTTLRSKVLHRVEGRRQPPELRPFWSFGAASLGPALAGFAEWVHERAAEAGADTVFCTMREGRLLTRLIEAAAPAAAAPVRAEPIWLSRQVCARASIREGSTEELAALFERRRMPTVGEFCATLGVETAEVRGFEGAARARLNEPGLAERLIERLSFEPELCGRIVAGSRALRARVLRYLERMRPPGADRLVLVDLGWGATIQSLVDGLLRDSDSDLRTTGLYLIATDRAADRMLDGADVHGFLANAGRPARPIDAFMRSPEILEQICMPEHGSQVGFDANLEPVLEPAEPLPLQSAQRETAQKGIAAFQREWVRYRTAMPDALVPLHEYGQDRLRSILVRSLTAPTVDEAGLFAGWLHDENFGSAGLEPLVAPTSARAARYLEPRALLETPMTEIYWPFGLAALYDEHLAKAVEASTAGVVPWEEFSSELETGPVEIYCDRGWGFRSDGMAVARARRNRLGLSYARGTVAGDLVRRVRVDLAKAPCVVRLDWLRLRCHRRGADTPVVLDCEDPRDLGGLTLRGMRSIGPTSFLVAGNDPNVVVDVEELAGGEVHTVDVECGFAVLALPASGLRRHADELQARLRERAKRGRLAGPLRAAYGLLRKIG